MAVTFNDGDLATLSKLKFGSTSYALKDAAARTNITALDSAITVLNGAVDSAGSVLKMIHDNAASAVYDTGVTIADAIAANTSAIALLNSTDSTAGSVAYTVKNNAGGGTFTFTGAETATTIAAAIQANADAIAAQGKGMFKVVTADSDIPVNANGLGYIYLVPDVNEGYKEWIVINTGTEAEPVYTKEEIGDTHIDLTDYATHAWVTSNAKDAVYSVDTTDPESPVTTTIAQAIAANTPAIASNASAISALDSAVGTWTSVGRTDTVKEAIETLESQVTGTTVKSVNGVAADAENQGAITIYGDIIARTSDTGASTIDAALTALESSIGQWSTGSDFASNTVKEAIEANDSAIDAIKANTASALTSLSGGTWELDETDTEMMVWTAITTSDATFLSGETV